MEPALQSDQSSLLVITGVGVPAYSARGITQTLEPIDGAAQLFRSVNGVAMDFSHEQFRKYKTNISCTDQQAPALDGVWPGKVVSVECVAELSYLTAGGAPARPVVPGSSREEGIFTYYRPVLLMMVTAINAGSGEWTAEVAWSFEAEEF